MKHNYSGSQFVPAPRTHEIGGANGCQVRHLVTRHSTILVCHARFLPRTLLTTNHVHIYEN